jgi:predicted nucleic acid-binding protein
MKAADVNTYIIDSSFILAFLFPDEENEQVSSLFKQYREEKVVLIAPSLLPLEVINGLKSGIKRKRISQKQAIQFLNKFLAMEIDFQDISLEQVLQFSVEKDISVYDATYLCLAKQEKIPLLSLDKKIGGVIY